MMTNPHVHPGGFYRPSGFVAPQPVHQPPGPEYGFAAAAVPDADRTTPAYNGRPRRFPFGMMHHRPQAKPGGHAHQPRLHNSSGAPAGPPEGTTPAAAVAAAAGTQVWAYTVFVTAPAGIPLRFSRALTPLRNAESGNYAAAGPIAAASGSRPAPSREATLVDLGSGISEPKSAEQAAYPAEFLEALRAAAVSTPFPAGPVSQVPLAADSWSPHHHCHHHGPGVCAYDRATASVPHWASRRPATPVGRYEADEPLLHFNAHPEHPSTYTVTQISRDVHELRKELSGIIKDGKPIIAIVGHLTPEEMQMLALSYKSSYGESLAEAFNKHATGRFGKLLHAIATPPVEYDCICIRDAISKLGVTDEDALMEILVGRRNCEIRAIRETYLRLYGRDLEKEVAHDLSGPLKRLFVALLQGRRDESGQLLDVPGDVRILHDCSSGASKDRADVISVLVTRNDNHLQAVFREYEEKHGNNVEKLVKKVFRGELERWLLSLVHSIKDRPLWAAELFEACMAGATVRDATLIRLGTRFRHPLIMNPIKEAYSAKFGTPLEERIAKNTARDYGRLLLALVAGSGGPAPPDTKPPGDSLTVAAEPALPCDAPS